MDRLLDTTRIGPLHLKRPEFAEMVLEALLYRAREGHYTLHNFVIMANHVHLLITPRRPYSAVMQSLKRITARQGNKILGSTGEPFWQDESYDRFVRAQIEFERIADYIENNPVSAGLCARPEDFPWSSARPTASRPQDAILPHKNSEAHTPTTCDAFS